MIRRQALAAQIVTHWHSSTTKTILLPYSRSEISRAVRPLISKPGGNKLELAFATMLMLTMKVVYTENAKIMIQSSICSFFMVPKSKVRETKRARATDATTPYQVHDSTTRGGILSSSATQPGCRQKQGVGRRQII